MNPAIVDNPFKPAKVRMLLFDAVRKCKGIELAIRILSVADVASRRPVFGLSDTYFLYAMPLCNDAAVSIAPSIDPPIP